VADQGLQLGDLPIDFLPLPKQSSKLLFLGVQIAPIGTQVHSLMIVTHNMYNSGMTYGASQENQTLKMRKTLKRFRSGK
jgi:hypothetical protein